MYISKFSLQNYKSYRDLEQIELGPGFNVIVGRNNVGKTALLEGLSLRFDSNPHRSLETVPERGAPYNSNSKAAVTIAVGAEEFRFRVMSPDSILHLPRPLDWRDRIFDGVTLGDETAKISFLLEWFLGQNPLFFELERQGNEAFRPSSTPSFANYRTGARVDSNQDAAYSWIEYVDVGKPGGGGPRALSTPYPFDPARFVVERLLAHTYMFRAERRIEAQFGHGARVELTPDAANLPEVLNTLKSNSARYKRLNALVNEILPDVQWVDVVQLANNQLKVVVWNHDPETERDDLAVSLADCGSGIGQIVALVYVVLTSETAKTIIIDEPHSFLHPGAVRKLLAILQGFPQHQYIIATHSPTVVTGCNPDTITVLRMERGVTHAEQIDPSDADRGRVFLAELGARLSDVFGAESVLWVEGPTEELCLPLIARRLAPEFLRGAAIVGLLHTGDFDSKRAVNAFRLYKKLSASSSLVPNAIGFFFDREDRSETDRNDLEREGRQNGIPVAFTARRLFENYLLNPRAIAAAVNEEGLQADPPISTTPEEITAELDELKRNGEMYRRLPKPTDLSSSEWLDNIHGAKVLERIVTSRKLVYDKVNWAARLTRWVLDNRPEDLAEIAEEMRAMARRMAGTG